MNIDNLLSDGLWASLVSIIVTGAVYNGLGIDPTLLQYFAVYGPVFFIVIGLIYLFTKILWKK